MKRAILVLVGIICISSSCGSLQAAPTAAGDAEMVVKGWLSLDPQPLGVPLGREVLSVETFTNDQGDVVYYVVYLRPAGFVVVSADDLVEPIIAFAAEGIYDPAPESPLGALVTADLYSRVEAARETPVSSTLGIQAVSEPRQKWDDLILIAHKPTGDIAAMGTSPICTGGPSDLRVAPLTNTRWDQGNVYSSSGLAKACYNYFTPQVLLNGTEQWVEGDEYNYPCGCLATAMAQLMYFHRCPKTGYAWNEMVSAPDYSTPDAQRRAIGRLCRDAGREVGMEYTASGSGANTLDAADALKRAFGYSNAVKGYNGGINIGEGLETMINPGLDGGNPAILGIFGPGGIAHGALADGYGYDSASTQYHHLNMGVSGADNCWYNLPAIKCPTLRTSDGGAVEFNVIKHCVYNIFKTLDNGASVTGEIISGRVTNNVGNPIVGARVTAYGTGGGGDRSVTTNDKGIYAFVGVASGQTYTIDVEKSGYTFVPRSVTVGQSLDGGATSGNRWDEDFKGTLAGGCNPATLAWTWMKGSSFANQSGTYGTRGTAGVANGPAGRYKPVMWADSSGRLWLFAGSQQDSGGNWMWCNDLWRYDPATGNWAWMKGSNWATMCGVYGTRGVSGSSNTPGARDGTMVWNDSADRLWLFGGYGCDTTAVRSRLNDLWQYDPATGNWTWMKGSSLHDQAGIYGTRGVANTNNTPGGRDGGVTWVDSTGVMWLFGGYGLDSQGNWGHLNDLWRYDPLSGNWTWMHGSNVVDRGGVYGTRNVPHALNTPGARWSAMSWTDPAGGLWLFGGLGRDNTNLHGSLNDLWRYDRGSGNWAWAKGSGVVDQRGVYGTRGIPAAANVPGARRYGATWTDPDGTLWLFGGYALDETGSLGYINDLWRYSPATAEWTWMKGANAINQSAAYGTRGTSSTANTPGPRWAAPAVKSPAGQAWLFGGYGRDSIGNWGYLNDLWQISCAP